MIAFNDVVNLADVHAVLFAKGVGHLTIDFDDHQLRAFNGSALPEIRGAKVEVPAIIHRASLQDGDINRIEEATVIIRHLSEIERGVVATSGIVFLAVVAGKMPAE